MKVLVLCGPESSGKSWLAERIREQFGAVVVDEYVREFIDAHRRDTCYADIPAIALGQLQREDAARSQQPELLVLDTHLLSNLLWSQTLFGDCPDWLESALLQRHYDLHLLLSPEQAPWVADGQRCQPDLILRQRFYDASEQWLKQHDQRYVVIDGDWTARQAQAMDEVRRLLASQAT